jgi:hypothetical protein
MMMAQNVSVDFDLLLTVDYSYFSLTIMSQVCDILRQRHTEEPHLARHCALSSLLSALSGLVLIAQPQFHVD